MIACCPAWNTTSVRRRRTSRRPWNRSRLLIAVAGLKAWIRPRSKSSHFVISETIRQAYQNRTDYCKLMGWKRKCDGRPGRSSVNAPTRWSPRRPSTGWSTIQASCSLTRIHRRDTAAVVRHGARGQGTGWRRPDVGEIVDVERGCRAKGMLTARSSGVGRDFQRRPQAETVRGPAWRRLSQTVG